MTGKEKIKEEIERRISQFEAKYPKDLGGYWNDEESAAFDCAEEYKRFLQFIDSLSEEPASEDLKEEIDRFEDWLNNFNQSDYPTSYTVRDIARHFAEWQKQQMMEDAVEAIVHQGLYSKYVTECDNKALANVLKNYNSGDRVKIIIIKTEQQ